MIVYNLKCRHAHHFEAWFPDSAAYQDHVEGGRVACPVCGSKKVEKAPMAPRLAKGARGPWELYDIESDRTELHNLADAHPERARKLAEAWEAWAVKAKAKPWPYQPKRPKGDGR